MKTQIKEALKSSYQSIINYFSWLLNDETKKKPFYESEEEEPEQELLSVVSEPIVEEVKTKTTNHNLTEKQDWMFNYVCSFDDYVSPTKVGRNWGVAFGKNHICGSQQSYKTLSSLVQKGLLVKNAKGKYKKA
jgi:hypothetical protein